MVFPISPENENQRLAALKGLEILDSLPEREYDEITRLAAYICQTPISLISLVGQDQNWFKSKVGTDISGNERKYSHCAHAILEPGKIMEVPDTRKDIRFADNPFTLAKNPILFYSGVPLLDKKGHALGTLCVVDNVPRQLDRDQKNALLALGNQVSRLFELRERNLLLKKMQQKLKKQNSFLKNFAGIVSHDMKMPLANMVLTIDMLKSKYSQNIDDKGKEYLDNLKQASFGLSNYINGILDQYERNALNDDSKPTFKIHSLLDSIVDLMNITENAVINFPKKNIELICNKIALEQIFLNLINNSLKYNDKEKIIIDIDCSEDTTFYYFTLTDNGIGISSEKQKDIFKRFTTTSNTDRKGQKGSGIGLATVKSLVKKHGGSIEVSSEVGKSTTFQFKIKKNVA